MHRGHLTHFKEIFLARQTRVHNLFDMSGYKFGYCNLCNLIFFLGSLFPRGVLAPANFHHYNDSQATLNWVPTLKP